MNFVYHGDSYIIEEKVNELKSQIGNDDSSSTNINIFNANEIKPTNLLNTCYSIPFLSSKRLVVINGLLSIFESPKSALGKFNATKPITANGKKLDWDSIVEELPKFPDTTLLVFSDIQLSSNNKMLNKIRPYVDINYFPQPTGNNLTSWIKKSATSKNCQLEDTAITELVRYTGNNLRKIDSELEKLSLYCTTKTITLLDIEKLVIPISNPNLFSSIDAILSGNKQYAFTSLIDLMKLGTPAQLIISLLGKQIKTLILIKSLIHQGASNRDINKRIPVSNYALQKLTKMQTKISLTALQHMHKILVDTDYKIKTTTNKIDLTVELMIIELSTYAISKAHPKKH